MCSRRGWGNGTGVPVGTAVGAMRILCHAVGCGVGDGSVGGACVNGMVIGGAGSSAHDRRMHVITPSAPAMRRGFGSMVLGLCVGIFLVTVGLTIGYLALATPFMERVIPLGRPTSTQAFVGLIVWSFALVGPAIFLLLGTSRLAWVLGGIDTGSRNAHTPAARHAHTLPEDLVAVIDVDPGDGRRVPEIVLGPFGAAVIRELPPPSVTRHLSGTWELRTKRGWIPLENPVDRASRDADRVRSWLANDDHDFVVKVHTAVVGSDETVERTANCAVITPDQVPAWLASLPVQRSLTDGRRERLVEMLGGAI